MKKNKEEEKIVPTAEEVQKTADVFILERMRFISSLPFYGILLLEVDPQACGPEIPIAAINYKNIYLNAIDPKRVPADQEGGVPFWSFKSDACKTILVHEICHLVFEHLNIPRDYNSDIANIAMDAVINRIIANDKTLDLSSLPEGVVTPISAYNGYSGFTIGKGDKKKTFDIPDYDKKDWLPIYWDIYHQLEKEAKAGGCKTREEIAEGIKKRAEKMAGANPMHGDAGQEGEGEEDTERAQQRAKFRQKVVSAVEQAKAQGNLPAEFARFVDNLEDGKVHWTTHLRRLLKTEITRDDFANKVNSRRAHIAFGGRRTPPIFPKVESEALGDVYLALDTSGSMSPTDIQAGLSEFASLRQTVPFRLHFVSCDAKAYETTVYDRHEEPDWTTLPIHGGGGTDFRPVFSMIEHDRKEHGVRPALLVYFTDTMGSFPEEEPDYPCIWVCNWPHGKVPFGTLVSTVD